MATSKYTASLLATIGGGSVDFECARSVSLASGVKTEVIALVAVGTSPTTIWQSSQHGGSSAKTADFSELHLLIDPDDTLSAADAVYVRVTATIVTATTTTEVQEIVKLTRDRPFVCPVERLAGADSFNAQPATTYIVTKLDALVASGGTNAVPVRMIGLK